MSKTVIDELVVSIGLDSKGFAAGAKQVQETIKTTKTHVNALGETITTVNTKIFKEEKEKQEGNKKTAESYGLVTNSIYKLTAAFLGVSAVKSFVADVTNADSALGRLSRNLNMKPEEIKGFEGVAAKFGVSSEEIDAAFTNTANVMAKYRMGMGLDPTFMMGLGRAQIDFLKFLATSTTESQRFLMVQEALNKAIDSKSMTRYDAIAVGGMMGFSPQVVTMMMETKGKLLDLVAAYIKLNKDTKEYTDGADARLAGWVDLTAAAGGMGRALLEDVNPAITVTLGLLSNVAEGWKMLLKGENAEKGSPWDRMMHWLGKPEDESDAEIAKRKSNQTIRDISAYSLPGEKERGDAFAAKLKARLNPDFAEQLHSKLNARFKGLGSDMMGGLGNYQALADLIARGESGSAGYSAVNLGQAGEYKSSTANLSEKTLNQILKDQAEHKYGAAGRYQVMPTTLKEGISKLGLSGEEKFTNEFQDMFFKKFLIDMKHPSVGAALSGGEFSSKDILTQLSNEWAAVKNPYDRGTHDKEGVNRATIGGGSVMDVVNQTRASRTTHNNTNSTASIGTVNIYAGGVDAKDVADRVSNSQRLVQLNSYNQGMRQ